MTLKAVKFLCAVPRIASESGTYQMVYEHCAFKLGLGPCGRTVVKLDVRLVENGNLIITQTTGALKVTINPFSYDVAPLQYKEVKEFIYKDADIYGRVELILM